MLSYDFVLQNPLEKEQGCWNWSHHFLHILQQCPVPILDFDSIILCSANIQSCRVSFTLFAYLWELLLEDGLVVDLITSCCSGKESSPFHLRKQRK